VELLTTTGSGRVRIRHKSELLPQQRRWLGLLCGRSLRGARPLPSVEELAIEGLTSDEWNALNRVLAER